MILSYGYACSFLSSVYRRFVCAKVQFCKDQIYFLLIQLPWWLLKKKKKGRRNWREKKSMGLIGQVKILAQLNICWSDIGLEIIYKNIFQKTWNVENFEAEEYE